MHKILKYGEGIAVKNTSGNGVHKQTCRKILPHTHLSKTYLQQISVRAPLSLTGTLNNFWLAHVHVDSLTLGYQLISCFALKIFLLFGPDIVKPLRNNLANKSVNQFQQCKIYQWYIYHLRVTVTSLQILFAVIMIFPASILIYIQKMHQFLNIYFDVFIASNTVFATPQHSLDIDGSQYNNIFHGLWW